MTSILVVGDLHFKLANQRYTTQLQTELETLVRNRSLAAIVLLGDILDTFENSDEKPMTRVTQLLQSLLQHVPHIYILVGNHDRGKDTNLFASATTLSMLALCPNITLALETTTITINNQVFVLVPYVDPGRFRAAMRHDGYDYPLEGDSKAGLSAEGLAKLAKVRAVFAHQEFRGVKMGAMISEVGDEWPLSNPLCVSGHVHDAQRLAPNLYYTGTPAAHGHGEQSNKKLEIYTFEEQGFHVEEIPLHIGRKLTIKVKLEDLASYDPPSNCDVRIRVVATPVQFRDLQGRPEWHRLTSIGVKFKREDPVIALAAAKPIQSNVQFWPHLAQTIHQTHPDLANIAASVLGLPMKTT